MDKELELNRLIAMILYNQFKYVNCTIKVDMKKRCIYIYPKKKRGKKWVD